MNLTGKFVSQAAANTNHDYWLTAEEAFNYADPKCNAYVKVANGFPADAAFPVLPGAATMPTCTCIPTISSG